MNRVMRPYQGLGYKDIFDTWSHHDVIMFVLGTGGGKTFTFTEVIRWFASRRMHVMLVAHREELITQAWKTLYDAGMYSGIIQGKNSQNEHLPIQVCSIQTIQRRKRLPHADLIVIDEAHHVQDDNTYGKLLAKYPHAKVLMVTATPYRLSGEGFVNIVPGKITQLIINCTVRELIDQGWLVPLSYRIGSTPDMSNVRIGASGDWDAEEALDAMAMAPLVESYIDHCLGMQGLGFYVNIQHAQDVADKYNAMGISATCISSHTPEDERRALLDAYSRGEIKVITNCDVFSEGTDLPFCQFVQHGAPTRSLSKRLQRDGRATRALPGIVDAFPGDHQAAQRIDAIARSAKPYGIILDNAGLYLTHGFPDEHIDWEYYFKGWANIKPKKQQLEELEFIEVPIFDVMDPKTGTRRRTENPAELDGMILIEVTKEMRENIKAKRHLSQFDKFYEDAIRFRSGKPGYYAYKKFREYCSRRNIDIDDKAWAYLREKLVIENERMVNDKITEMARYGQSIVPSSNNEILKIKSLGVDASFLRREQQVYKGNLKLKQKNIN